MNEPQEMLSGLLDDWKGDHDDRAALDRVLADVNERARWQRYQMIGEVMRHELPERIQADFSASVMANIEQLDMPPATAVAQDRPRKAAGSWWSSLLRPVAGLSVAVAVAFVAVTSLTRSPGPSGVSAPVVTASSSAVPSDPRIEQLAQLPVLAPSVKVSAAGSSTPAGREATGSLPVRRDNAAIKRKLNGYLVDHNQYAGSLQGIIPQVRVVAAGAQN